jgi:cell division protease FtsH
MYGDNQDETFLGYVRQQTISEATARKIDAEVRRLMEAGLADATRILTEKRQDLETLAKGLLEYETLPGEEIVELLKGHLPVRDTGYDREPSLRGSPVPPAGVVWPKPGPEPGGLEPRLQA